MTNVADRDWLLALVLCEPNKALFEWMGTSKTLALRVFPDDRALGPADRQLACDVVVMMRSGEELEPSIVVAYAVDGPFVLRRGAELLPGYPHAAAHELYWTARLEPLPDASAWQAVVQDARARSDELVAATPADSPPVVWMAAALRREGGRR